MATYYRQRSSAGLILSEATSVDPMGVGYPDTPGIWSDAQVTGWRAVTDAVHQASGRIFLQLWHVGRISHPQYLNGALPVAPSALAASGHVSLVRPKTSYPVPRALELKEIAGIVAAYRQGAQNAKRAGFDGVEIHGANGYLLDQFLQDNSNKRTDAYGGSIENRARLLLEVTDAAVEVFGPGRVGMHLAPRGDSHTMGDSNPKALFGYVAEQLSRRKIAFLCVRESIEGTPRLGPYLRQCFKGVYIANEGLSVDVARQLLTEGQADAAAFGRHYIANPDLVERIGAGAELSAGNSATFYGSGAEGYTDYPPLKVP
jgi:2,4-dienoyl-CoA reductase-like NADH-dependent reductase (Old Yellow Enzyme family)